MSGRRAQPLPVVGDLEHEVLEHLWRVGEADVGETHAVVGAPRHITLNTVGSALERLFRKRLVARRKVSHAYRYHAALARPEYRARRAVEASGGLTALANENVLAAFVDMLADHDEKTLARLEALVALRRRARGSR